MDDKTLIEIISIGAMVLSLIVAIVGHEIMHGFSAYKFGDTTAKNAGRLSINPISHIDPIGTIAVPALLYLSGSGFLFGWAKPVPVNFSLFLKREKEGIIIALAGIAYNLALALLASILIALFNSIDSLVELALYIFLIQLVLINLVLALLNLLPIPPLDGAKALLFGLKKFGYDALFYKVLKYERYGIIVVFLVIATPLSIILYAPYSALATTLLSEEALRTYLYIIKG